jgi:plastocyanin
MRTPRIAFSALTLGLSAVLLVPASLTADERHRGRDIVTVAFGAGLNTAQPGNSDNHHVLPRRIRVKAGDVVNFVVAGLHVIRVYDDGVRLGDVKLQIPDECEVNPIPPAPFPPQCFFEAMIPVPVIPPLGLGVFYEGLNPLAPPVGAPPFAQPSVAVNRVEPIVFLEPGRFLVICAVLPHFNDRMYAWVEVVDKDQDDDHDDDHHDDRDEH